MSWYDRVNGQMPMTQSYNSQPFSGLQFQNPLQRAQYMMWAMSHPVDFIKQHCPDIPDSIINDPNQVLSYLQQTRGISDQQIRQLTQQNPYQRRY